MRAPFPSDVLSRARELFPHLRQGKLYLNHAGTSPLSTRVVAAMTSYLRRRSEGALDTYQEDVAMVSSCRAAIARLIRAESAERISFHGSTSDAINVIASGIPWKTGDRILVGDSEFPANIYPYLNLKPLGVEVDFIEAPDGRLTADLVASRMGQHTRLLALSAVQYLSGYREDLRSIGIMCRNNSTILAVDGIQAAGAIRLDVQKMYIDALSAGSQKWQMGPHGTGFLYLTDDLQARIRQRNLGWLSVENPWDFHNFSQPLASSARRYEGGSLNMPGLWGLQEAIATLIEFGPDGIESHILAVTSRLMERLSRIDGLELFSPVADEERGGIVTVSLAPPLDARAVFGALQERGATIALRDGMLRYSPHFYNTIGEMDEVAEMTEEAVRSSRR
ncbi:MAG TPA: aminotransferase class V-fold PLP-dependent enzyme [Bacteroidota bacterium]|nr:aminotransferase class V-fold PLP-dependent enzyme [Bacteroidota bacterium]